MLRKSLVILLFTITCKQEPDIVTRPYKETYQTKDLCPIEEWYNIDGIEVRKCYR
jgi:hypothetical protein